MIEPEIWKNVKDFEDYQISNYGRIKSLKFRKERIISLVNDRDGYRKVHFSENGINYTRQIHRLVFETYVGEIPKCYIVHHIDENKENNYYKNFELKPSASEHQTYHMTGNKNPNYGKHKTEETKIKMSKHNFTKEHVITIRQMIKEGIQINWIASLFECSCHTIENIKFGRTYKFYIH